MIWFSAGELARLGKEGVSDIPTTDPGCTLRAQKSDWMSRVVDCMGGKKGKRTEYQPPADVLALIQAFLEENPDFFGKDKRRPAGTGAPPPVKAGIVYEHGKSADPFVTGLGKMSGVKLQEVPHPPEQTNQHAANNPAQCPVALDVNRLRLALVMSDDAASAVVHPMTAEQKADLVLTFYKRLSSGQ